MRTLMMQDISAQASTRHAAPFRPAAAGHVRPASVCSQARLSIHRSHTTEACSSGRNGQMCCRADVTDGQQPLGNCSLGRRAALAGAALSMLLLSKNPARAFITPPAGFRVHQDKLDGYFFFVPENWIPVTSSGNDIFYRNPYNVNENLFVDVSSPSSSNYTSVEDLGPPEAAAKRTLDQYLEELMSTRLGVQRQGEVLSADKRTGPDGKEYYDIQVRVRSYASRNQLAAYPGLRQAGQELEWERRYLTVLGAANKRLYQFRLQTADSTYEKAADSLLDIAQSFRCKEVVA